MGAEHAMSATIVDGWPAVAAKTAVLGLIADHVMPGTWYICLWADDDPGQLAEQTWERIQGDVPWIGGGFGRVVFVVDVGEPSCDGQ